jgi:ABC-type Fe3+ transport system substrate-binding protein
MMPKRLRWMPAVCAAVAVLVWPAPGRGADADLAQMVEAAKREGEVHFLDNQNQPQTAAEMERGFRKRYGLPDSFRVTHTLRGTGESVATVQQEIKAGQHTIDLMWVGGSASFLKAAAKSGDLLPYASPEWKHYEAHVKRLGLEAEPPQWITPTGYAFVPVWNRKCPGFASVQIKSWRDLLNPAFKGKTVIGDVRKSFTYSATWAGLEGALGKDFFPRLAEVVQPAVFFRTEEMLQKGISCEYPLSVWQLSGRVYQRAREDHSLDMAFAWPQEGVVVLNWPMAILKGTRHPNAAKLLMDYLLSEDGMRAMVVGEGVFSFREGLKIPEPVQKYLPPVEQVKSVPVNWAGLNLAEIKRIQNEFRKVFRVD